MNARPRSSRLPLKLQPLLPRPPSQAKPLAKQPRVQTAKPVASEVGLFLESINLAQLQSKFTAHGITSLPALLAMQPADLEALQLPLGYKLKVAKKVKMVSENQVKRRPETAVVLSRLPPKASISRLAAIDTEQTTPITVQAQSRQTSKAVRGACWQCYKLKD